jgi:hypothetical protein
MLGRAYVGSTNEDGDTDEAWALTKALENDVSFVQRTFVL